MTTTIDGFIVTATMKAYGIYACIVTKGAMYKQYIVFAIDAETACRKAYEHASK